MVILGLARRTIGHRLAGFVASFFALAFAALLVAVCGGLLETGIRSDVPPQRLLTAPILVTGTQSYDGESLAERVRLASGTVATIDAVPGVARTVSDVSFPLAAVRDGRPVGPTIVGHGWSSAGLTPYRLVSGRAPASADDVVVDAAVAARLHLAVGGRLDAVVRGAPAGLRVVGVAAASGAQAPTLFVTDARATALLGRPGKVDTIAVYPDRGTSARELAHRIDAALPGSGAQVLTGGDRGLAEFPDAAGQSTNLIPLAGASGGLMAAVAVFIVASTLALSVQLRRRQIALLSAIGATPGQVRRLVLGETFLLAVPAALALLPSAAIGRRLLAAFADHGLVASGLVYHQGFIPTLTGAGAAVLTGLGAALVAARGALRVRPVEALRADTTTQPWLGWVRLVFGLVTLAGAVALALVTFLVFDGPVAASTAEPSAMLWTVGIGLLAPAIARPVLVPLGRIAAVLAPRAGRLARQTVLGRGARNAAVIIPVMLASGLATSLLYLQTTQQAASDHAYARYLTADQVLTSQTGGLPPELAAKAARIPGVTAASPLINSSGFFEVSGADDDADSLPLQGIDGAAAGHVANYPVAAGSLSRLTGDTIAIPTSSRAKGRELGDTVRFRFGDNATARLRIVAVIETPRGYPTLLLPAKLLAAHTSTGLADQILISTADHASSARLAAALRGLAPGVRVADRTTALAANSQDQQTGAWVGYLFITALVVYTTVSLINSIVAATAQRRPQLRALRLLGASRGQMSRAMTIEALLLSGAGIVLGTFVALATLLPFDSALGTPGLPSGPWWIYVAVTGTATALTVVVTYLATNLLHTEPRHAAA